MINKCKIEVVIKSIDFYPKTFLTLFPNLLSSFSVFLPNLSSSLPVFWANSFQPSILPAGLQVRWFPSHLHSIPTCPSGLDSTAFESKTTATQIVKKIATNFIFNWFGCSIRLIQMTTDEKTNFLLPIYTGNNKTISRKWSGNHHWKGLLLKKLFVFTHNWW